MERGAVDYLTKPLSLRDVADAVVRALDRRHQMLSNRATTRSLKDDLASQTLQVHRERETFRLLSVSTLETLVDEAEARDPGLKGHSRRVGELAAEIGTELALDDEEVEHLRTAGRLHDLGKIGVKDAVFGKSGPLSPSEFRHIERHVEVALKVLQPLPHLETVALYIRHSHERWNGTGYPDGLSGEDIPLGSRIIAAAEIYDALVSPRPYRELLPRSDAIYEINALAGSALDGRVVGTLVRVVSGSRELATAPSAAEPIASDTTE